MPLASFARDEDILSILRSCRSVAVVGCSPDPTRDSYAVARFLQSKGYRIIPVNPNAAEKSISMVGVIGTKSRGTKMAARNR